MKFYVYCWQLIIQLIFISIIFCFYYQSLSAFFICLANTIKTSKRLIPISGITKKNGSIVYSILSLLSYCFVFKYYTSFNNLITSIKSKTLCSFDVTMRSSKFQFFVFKRKYFISWQIKYIKKLVQLEIDAMKTSFVSTQVQ